MARILGRAAAMVMSVAVFGCGHRVMVPPRIDLQQHEIIGVIDFNCAAYGRLVDSLAYAVTPDLRATWGRR